MTLLSLLGVTKRWPRRRPGRDERYALRNVSLEVEAGELVAVWGTVRSGRRTLLSVCGGLDSDIEGSVRFDGRDLAGAKVLGVEGGIGFAHPTFDRMHGVTIEQVAVPIQKTRIARAKAEDRAFEMLERVGAEHCAELAPADLDANEVARVMLARALIARPRLLLIDGPTRGLLAPERDAILALLQSVADEGIAVLMTVDEVPGITGVVSRLLVMHNGELTGDVTPKVASVTPIRAMRGAG